MADTLHFELVSPERLLVDAEVASVRVPGTEGQFTVLPGHAPVMSTVRPGIIVITDPSDAVKQERIFVRGGFAEVTPKGLVVLAEECVPLDELDKAALEQRLKDAQEDIEDAKTDDDRHMAEENFANIKELLDAANR